MLQLLIELLAQSGQFVGITKILGIHLLVELSCIGAVAGLVVGIGPFASRLRATGAIIAFRDSRLLFGVRAVLLGRIALHLFRLRAQHAFGFGLRLSFAFLRI